jgi:hypothetical protein
MPTVVKGVTEARRVLAKVSPELYKQMNARITVGLKDVQNLARSEVVDNIFGLRNFTDTGVVRESRTSRARAFPMYNAALVRKGLTYSIGKQKRTNNGFTALYSMLNKSAAGAIIETAGRLNPYGDERSQSNNPSAGAHFINAITGTFGDLQQTGKTRKTQGRLMGDAVSQRKAKLTHEILRSIDDTIELLQRQVNAN